MSKKKQSKSDERYFYFLGNKGEMGYYICDPELSAPSETSFDISFKLLANHERLLNALHLIYIGNV